MIVRFVEFEVQAPHYDKSLTANRQTSAFLFGDIEKSFRKQLVCVFKTKIRVAS